MAGATVDVEWTYPDGATVAQHATALDPGLAVFRLKTLSQGSHQVCVIGMAKDGYTCDPDMNWLTCMAIDVP